MKVTHSHLEIKNLRKVKVIKQREKEKVKACI